MNYKEHSTPSLATIARFYIEGLPRNIFAIRLSEIRNELKARRIVAEANLKAIKFAEAQIQAYIIDTRRKRKVNKSS